MSNNGKSATIIGIVTILVSIAIFVISHKWNINTRKQDRALEKKEKSEKFEEDLQKHFDEDIMSLVKNSGGDISQPTINKLAKFLTDADRNTKTEVLFNLIEYNLSKKSYADIFKKVNFNKISISDIPLSQLQCFEEIYFSDITMTESSLKGINFSGIPVNFQRANLNGCKFDGSQLCNSSFRDANLCNADFTESDLSFSDFSNADLRECTFDGALLFGVKLHNAKVASSTWFEDLHTIYSKEAKGIKYLQDRYEINPESKYDNSEYFLVTERKDWKVFPPEVPNEKDSYTTYKNLNMGLEFLLDDKLFNVKPFGEASVYKKNGVGSILFISRQEDAVLRIESQQFYGSDIKCLENLTPSKYDQIKESFKKFNRDKSGFIRTGFLGTESEYIYYEKFIVLKSVNKYFHFQLIHPTIDKKNYQNTTLYLEKTFKAL